MLKLIAYNVGVAFAAIILLFAIPGALTAQYKLKIEPVDREVSFITDSLRLETEFRNREACSDYIGRLPTILLSKGFVAASVDTVRLDSSMATIGLYIGTPMYWSRIRTDSADKSLLDAASWTSKPLISRPLNFQQLETSRVKVLNHLENNGYPFASVSIDSVQFINGALEGSLVVRRGPLYRIDSIRNLGTANISNVFLRQYLGILNGSIYKKEKLQLVSKKISELPYLQEKQPRR